MLPEASGGGPDVILPNMAVGVPVPDAGWGWTSPAD